MTMEQLAVDLSEMIRQARAGGLSDDDIKTELQSALDLLNDDQE